MTAKRSIFLTALLLLLFTGTSWATVILKVLAINPSKEKEQEVPLKTYLPAEAKPENVMNRDELEIGFDTGKSLYYVEKKVVLKPGETFTLEVQIEDIWMIKPEELETMQQRAERAFELIQAGASSDVGQLLYDNVMSTLKIILTRQEDAADELPQDHIAAYRLNLKLMEEAEKDLKSLEDLAIKGSSGGRMFGGGKGMGIGMGAGAEQKNLFGLAAFTWKLMFAIIGFLALLSFFSFVTWNRQLKDVTKAREIDMLAPEERLHERNRLLNLATRDGKTGLLNLNHFKQLLENEIEEAKKNGSKQISIIMADVDFFKRINDSFGHLAGDDVLKGVAEVLKRNSGGKNSFACRYGGEEFLLMLPNNDGENAEKLAEKLRKEIQEKEFLLGDKKTPHFVTASLGVVTFNRKETTDEFIKRVDKALYHAKETGRNRVYRAA